MKRFLLAVLIGAFAVGAAACDETAVQSSPPVSIPAATAAPQETAGTVSGRAALTPEAAEETASVSQEADAVPQEVTGDIVQEATESPVPEESFAYDDSHSIVVTYYDLEDEREVATQYPLDDPTDPQEVIDGVTKTLGTALGNDRIEVRSTVFSDGDLIVDFAPSVYELGLASAEELQLLDSIADTYLANVQGIRAVFYTVDGKPYSSEHIQLMQGEAYRSAS